MALPWQYAVVTALTIDMQAYSTGYTGASGHYRIALSRRASRLAVHNPPRNRQHQQAAHGHHARERVDPEVGRPRAIGEPADHRRADKPREIPDRVDQRNAGRRG